MRRITNEEAEYLGLGDVVAEVTKKFGVKPCKGCQKRQQKLNKLVPRVKRKRRR